MVFRRNPLDLNNLPDDFIRDHTKQSLDDSSSAASGIYRKKKNSSKDESGKVYECRFCSLTFRKSQALGGHMNRHRQERETETLNQARQLVFSNDNMLALPPHQQCGQPALGGGYPYSAGFNMGGTVYPTRHFPGTSTTILPSPPPPSPPPPPPPQTHHHAYTSVPSRLSNTYLSQYSNSPLISDYFVDRYVSSEPHFSFQNLSCATVPTQDHS